jgi:hypothetical protein
LQCWHRFLRQTYYGRVEMWRGGIASGLGFPIGFYEAEFVKTC